MRRMKYKYWVAIAYLDTDTDDIKVDYIETLSYNAKEAKKMLTHISIVFLMFLNLY